MKNHKERAHAILSASSAHRWLKCTRSARLEETFPDSTSEAANEGTLAHELAEAKLRNYFYPADFGKRKLSNFIKKAKENELWQDEMLEHTDTYLDYIKSIALSYKTEPTVLIERKVDYSEYAPEGFGTADCILISGGTLHVIDFKYGKGVPVSAEKNPQLMMYALGACVAYQLLYPIKEVRLSVVQPRLDDVSTWMCTIHELLGWGEFVKTQASLAWDGQGDFAPGEDTCRFCRAKAQCRARSDYNVQLAFPLEELPPLITAEEAGERLAVMVDVVKYQKDLQEWALSECLAGHTVPGWKAVEGRSLREWTDQEEAFKTLKENNIEEALLYEKKPLTLAQVEKAVGKKEFAEIAGSFVIKPPGKPTLVKESDKREAITNQITAEEAFKEEK